MLSHKTQDVTKSRSMPALTLTKYSLHYIYMHIEFLNKRIIGKKDWMTKKSIEQMETEREKIKLFFTRVDSHGVHH